MSLETTRSLFWVLTLFSLAIGFWFARRILVTVGLLPLAEARRKDTPQVLVLWLALAAVLFYAPRYFSARVLNAVHTFTNTYTRTDALAPSSWGNAPFWLYVTLDLGFYVLTCAVVIYLGWNRLPALLLGKVPSAADTDENDEGEVTGIGAVPLSALDQGVVLWAVGHLVYSVLQEIIITVTNFPLIEPPPGTQTHTFGYVLGWVAAGVIFSVIVYFMHNSLQE